MSATTRGMRVATSCARRRPRAVSMSATTGGPDGPSASSGCGSAFGIDDARRAARPSSAAKSGRPCGVSRPLMRTSWMPFARGVRSFSATTARASSLASGATASSRSRTTACAALASALSTRCGSLAGTKR